MSIRLWPNGSPTIPIVTSEFGGAHELTVTHRGIDLIGFTWNRAADDGVVTMAGMNGTAGVEVRIRHADGSQTRYLHNRTGSLLVRVGQQVKAGDALGRMGATGFARGVHCHFEVIAPDGVTRINPRTYITAGQAAGIIIVPEEDTMALIIRRTSDGIIGLVAPQLWAHMPDVLTAQINAAVNSASDEIHDLTPAEFDRVTRSLGIPDDQRVIGRFWSIQSDLQKQIRELDAKLAGSK